MSTNVLKSGMIVVCLLSGCWPASNLIPTPDKVAAQGLRSFSFEIRPETERVEGDGFDVVVADGVPIRFKTKQMIVELRDEAALPPLLKRLGARVMSRRVFRQHPLASSFAMAG